MKSKGQISEELTVLFATKINYDGEFNTLFFIEDERGEIIVNFLNEPHFKFILKHLHKEIQSIADHQVKFSHYNLKTSSISLKQQSDIIPTRIEPVIIEKKEPIELPTIRNKVIKEFEEFMSIEYNKLLDRRKEIEKIVDDCLDDTEYIAIWGEINFIAKLYAFLKNRKDYDE